MVTPLDSPDAVFHTPRPYNSSSDDQPPLDSHGMKKVRVSPQPQSKKIRVAFDVDENVVVEMTDPIAGGSGKAVHVGEDENDGCAGKRAHKTDDDEVKNAAAFGKKRRLPASFMGDGTDFPPKPKSGLMDFVGLLKIIFAKENDDGCVDILETAKRRGMTFPRPRWWPPEKKG